MSKIFYPAQLWQLTSTNAKELLREPGILFWGIVFPILMSLGLGVAFTKKSDILRKVAVISASPPSFLHSYGNIVSKTDDKGNFEIVLPDNKMGNTTFRFLPMNWKDAMVMLKRGSVNLVLIDNYGKPEYHFDPLNPDAQLTYLKLTKIYGHPAIINDENNAEIKPLTVIGTRYIDFLIPGLIAMGVMMSCMWGISYSLIEKRSKKLLRRMVATPMRHSHFLISLMAVRLGMNVIEALLLFVFAYFAFHITITGSISALIALFIAGNIAFAGLAVFISSNTSKTEVGNGLINAVVMPMMVLSGVFFSYHNFPDWSLPYIQNLPLTLLADGMRSVFVEGAGFVQISFPFFILLSIGIVFFSIGMKIFKWH